MPEQAQLHEPRTNCKVQADPEEHHQHDRAEQEGAQITQNFADYSFHFHFSFTKNTGELIL